MMDMRLEKHSHLAMSLLCVVCDWDRHGKVVDILEKNEAFFNLVSYGNGTASSKMLNYLGLDEARKAVCLSVLTADTAREVMDALDKKLKMEKPGRGISFIVEVEQGCYHRPVEFVKDTNGGIAMQQDSGHSLIMVVLNRGYTEEVMEAARASGATGGTVLHARGCGMCGMGEPQKFFGMTIAPEKEMLIILAQAEISGDIMAGIAEKAGPSTEAGAVSFSLPVSAVRGITA
jgi:nitrogen regulatory protein PII